jgi:hypothetical protein
MNSSNPLTIQARGIEFLSIKILADLTIRQSKDSTTRSLEVASKSIRPILRYETNKMEILGWLIIERFIEIFERFIFKWSVQVRMSAGVVFTIEGNWQELSFEGIIIERIGRLFEGNRSTF